MVPVVYGPADVSHAFLSALSYVSTRSKQAAIAVEIVDKYVAVCPAWHEHPSTVIHRPVDATHRNPCTCFLSPRPCLFNFYPITQQAHQAVLDEADGVLAAIPPGIVGPELSFLERYKEIAELLSAEAAQSSSSSLQLQQSGLGGGGGSLASGGPNARRAGALAVEMLAPCDGEACAGVALSDSTPMLPPPRSWAHLLRLSVPALDATAAAAVGTAAEEEHTSPVTAAQVHVLLAKLQALVASEHRVGSVRGVGHCSGGGYSSTSTLASAPAPYWFRGGRSSTSARGDRAEVSEIRYALARCLGAAFMDQNAQEAAPPEDVGGRRQRLAGGPPSGMMLLGTKRLPAEALIAPRVAV